MMQLDMRAHGFELSPPMRRGIRRAAEADLERYGDRIAEVGVVLFPADGPHGGAARGCRLSLRLRSGPVLAVVEVQDDLPTALGAALARLTYALNRQMDDRELAPWAGTRWSEAVSTDRRAA